LKYGDFGERIGGHLLCGEMAAIIEDDGHLIGVEHVT